MQGGTGAVQEGRCYLERVGVVLSGGGGCGAVWWG